MLFEKAFIINLMPHQFKKMLLSKRLTRAPYIPPCGRRLGYPASYTFICVCTYITKRQNKNQNVVSRVVILSIEVVVAAAATTTAIRELIETVQNELHHEINRVRYLT